MPKDILDKLSQLGIDKSKIKVIETGKPSSSRNYNNTKSFAGPATSCRSLLSNKSSASKKDITSDTSEGHSKPGFNKRTFGYKAPVKAPSKMFSKMASKKELSLDELEEEQP